MKHRVDRTRIEIHGCGCGCACVAVMAAAVLLYVLSMVGGCVAGVVRASRTEVAEASK